MERNTVFGKEQELKHEMIAISSVIPYEMYVKFQEKLIAEGLNLKRGLAALVENYINEGND